jgi:hypothetical protein
MGIADNDFAAEQQGYFSLVSRLSALIQRGLYHSGWFRKGRTMCVLIPIKQIFRKTQLLTKLLTLYLPSRHPLR